jgi:hypothetical protein
MTKLIKLFAAFYLFLFLNVAGTISGASAVCAPASGVQYIVAGSSTTTGYTIGAEWIYDQF